MVAETNTHQSSNFEPKRITTDSPWRWLSKGWQDLRKAPSVGLFYGALFAAFVALMLTSVFNVSAYGLFISAASGIVLLAPICAVGLYEASRRLEAGEPVRIVGGNLFNRIASPGQLTFFGVLLLILFLVWVRIATLLLALFMSQDYAAFSDFMEFILNTPSGLTLLVVGSVIGAGMAFAAFAISAVSVPLMMARDVDAFTAIVFSINAVRKNFVPMLVWAWIIIFAMGLGFATLCLGLIVAFPVIGHATWHAYREISGN